MTSTWNGSAINDEDDIAANFLELTCGFRGRQLRRVIAYYGSPGRAQELVQRNPYSLMRCEGFGFIRADRVARERLDVALDDPRRLMAIVVDAFRSLDDGHCFLSHTQTIAAVQRVGAKSPSVPQLTREQAIAAIQDAINRGWLTLEHEGDTQLIWLSEMLRAEQHCAAFIRLGEEYPEDTISRRDAVVVTDVLSLDQWRAVGRAFSERFSLITGGPGVGKTRTIAMIVQLAVARGEEVALLAPTGVARLRLEEMVLARNGVPHEAWTIHRYRAQWGHEDAAPAPDLIVVDEASMVDLMLFSSVVSMAEEAGARLCVVGDPDQLPSIGPGNVLGDISAAAPVGVTATRLTFNYRAGDVPALVAGAAAVLAGEAPTEGVGLTATYCPAEAVGELVTAVVGAELAAGRPAPPVCTPMNKDAAALNQAVQAVANPGRAGLPSWESPLWKDGNPRWKGGPVLRVGDRVMHLENDYEREVMNGDVGIVRVIRGDAVAVDYGRGIDTWYDFGNYLDREVLTLGYSFTVHKSQGGEHPTMIVALSKVWDWPPRNLLYTALSRAQEQAVLIGPASAFQRVARNREPTRNTRLTARILGRI